ncbi:MAG: FTR1 family protein, partial [Jatrophihabitantaceae bacterium]
MTWSLAFPNLLVGLREGLEAGLIVTILIGAVRRLAPGRSLASVWLGVVAAAVLSLSFGAVLTFTRAELSPHAQELFGGTTSLIAVALVTSMIFWMRRTARALSGELREQVGRALTAGGLALAVTAFVAVAREGLETALFVWTNAQAAGSSGSPLAGALLGLVLASGLCVGLYRRVLRVNLARFFTVTGAVLI